ncbi:MAG: endoribonuclease MazF [Syntrophomonas sp.]|uniref:endoribonuclease MazF n=1 Tax=Syntrophomonas sp. TaxID=2053627 RepID=UPI002602525C|nr:endoribonuclease MazF [Syntrophomonas sp.]MDD2510926.1 endoribonuclease MazF [Syntrophomonas sp.]MDD4626890.1 endoribonuclease MazF [Syntrophomonas sp.]
MVKSYIPKRGDIIWLEFDTQSGHEQAGKRPALVISPKAYNHKTSLLLACPITSQIKGYPFEVAIPSGLQIQGVILTDQVKSLDWQARNAQFACQVPDIIVKEVVERIRILLD